MNEFKASQLAGMAGQSQIVLSSVRAGILIMKRGGDPPNDLDNQMADAFIDSARRTCTDLGLIESLQQISLAESHLKQTSELLTLHSFHAHVERIIETIVAELRKRKFLFVSSDRTDFFENEKSFGLEVIKRFPLAKDDIVAAGNCLCAECYTASVFHLMRVFEWALRALCAELGFERMKDFDKKTQKFKYMPASFGTWEKIIGQLAKKADKRINGLRPGTKRQNLQEYYNVVDLALRMRIP